MWGRGWGRGYVSKLIANQSEVEQLENLKQSNQVFDHGTSARKADRKLRRSEQRQPQPIYRYTLLRTSEINFTREYENRYRACLTSGFR